MSGTQSGAPSPATSDLEQTIASRFEAVVRSLPNHMALSGRGEQWTYDQLNRRANQIALAIQARTTAGPGCVAHLFDVSPGSVVAAMAVLKSGKACLPIHPAMPGEAQQAIVRDAVPDLILAGEALAPLAHSLADGVCPVLVATEVDAGGESGNPASGSRPEDPALIAYTSGTTGRPKGVVWSHRNMVHRTCSIDGPDALSPGDRVTLLRHFAVAAGQADVMISLLRGATLCVFDVVSEGLSAFRQWIGSERITVIRTPTLLLRSFLATLQDDERLASVRLVSVGGDTVLPADVERWKRHFVSPATLYVRFSASECGLLTLARFDHESDPERIGTTAGRPLDYVTLLVLNDEGRPVAPDAEGDLVVCSPHLADGYWRRPEETARAFGPDPERPGRRRYRTGDRGRLLSDGRFQFVGRGDRQVKIRGHRVDLGEVESALRELDEVSEAVIEAVKEGESQRLLAFVVLRDGTGLDQAGLRTRMLARLPEWKVPARFFAFPALPITLSGKVDRQRLKGEALRREEEEVAAAAAAGEPLDALETQIAEAWRELLRCGPLGPDDDFFLTGGDSLQATVLHLNIERLAGTQIPVETLFKQPTIRGMAEVIRESRRARPGNGRTRPQVLVPFRSTGSHPPLFLVHGAPGWSFARPEFMSIVGTEQPVYGFQASGLDRSLLRRNTIPEMARGYVSAMRRVQPHGPYFIGAACIGFIVAIEMANQLRAAGEQVGPLIFIDPRPANKIDALVLPWWRRYQRIARLHVRKWTGRKRLEARWSPRLRSGDPDHEASLRIKLEAMLDFKIARLKHTHWHYDGPVLILSSTKRMKRHRRDRGGKQHTFGGRLTGHVQWFAAGKNHGEVVGARSMLAAREIVQCVEIARNEIARLRRETGGSPQEPAGLAGITAAGN